MTLADFDTTNWPRFAIINDSDFPGPNCVVQLTHVGYCYMDGRTDPVRYGSRRFDGMVLERTTTSLQDFGFEVIEYPHHIMCRRVRDSIATYGDGVPRRWQGAEAFSLPLVTDAKLRNTAHRKSLQRLQEVM